MEYDVTIIGGGVSGLTTAYELKKHGKKVIVLERESEVAGRTRVFQYKNTYIPRGAGFILQAYTETIRIAKELKIEIEPLNHGNLGFVKKNEIYRINKSNPLNIISTKLISTSDKFKILLSIPNLILKVLQTNLFQIKSLLKYDNIACDKFIKKIWNNEIYNYIVEPICYAPFRTGPKNFSKALLLGAIRELIKNGNMNYYVFRGGPNVFCDTLANSCNVITNAKVTKVSRNKNHVIVAYTLNDKTFKIKTKQAIFAIPGNKILEILENPLKHEIDLLSNVEYGSSIELFFKAKSENKYLNLDYLMIPKSESSFLSYISFEKKLSNNKDVFFCTAIRDEEAKKLIREDKIDLVSSLAEKELQKFFTNIKFISTLAVWKESIPQFKPGYFNKLAKFIANSQKETQIFYCGDYLFGPYIEASVKSGLLTVQKII